jgi:hypothetical protein
MTTATHKDKALVTSILMSAFLNDTEGNSLNFLIQGEKNRKKRVQILFDYIIQRALLTGEIYISENKKGVIIVTRSVNKSNSLLLAYLKLKVMFLSIGFKHIPRIAKRQKILDRYHVEKNYVYPEAMAAHTSVRGKGTCVRMIIKLLKENAGTNQTIYTETTTEENLKIYKKFGFEVIGETDELGFTLYFLKNVV